MGPEGSAQLEPSPKSPAFFTHQVVTAAKKVRAMVIVSPPRLLRPVAHWRTVSEAVEYDGPIDWRPNRGAIQTTAVNLTPTLWLSATNSEEMSASAF